MKVVDNLSLSLMLKSFRFCFVVLVIGCDSLCGDIIDGDGMGEDLAKMLWQSIPWHLRLVLFRPIVVVVVAIVSFYSLLVVIVSVGASVLAMVWFEVWAKMLWQSIPWHLLGHLQPSQSGG